MRLASLTLAVLLVAAPLAARADDDADRHAAAAEVLAALHSTDMIAGILPSITAQVRLNLTHNDPSLGKEFDALQPGLVADAEKKKPELLDKLVDVYAHTFTLDELHDMLAYYRSPVGQRIIATQGAINREMLSVARDWGNEIGKTMSESAAAVMQGTKPPTP